MLNGRKIKTIHFKSCLGSSSPARLQLFLCIYCNVSLFLIKFSTILFTSACVPMAPVVFVQPKRA